MFGKEKVHNDYSLWTFQMISFGRGGIRTHDLIFKGVSSYLHFHNEIISFNYNYDTKLLSFVNTFFIS